MHLASLISVLLLGVAPIEGKRLWNENRWNEHLNNRRKQTAAPPVLPKRDVSTSEFMTAGTKKFYVDGTSLPEVTFDAGESYAGTLPNDENGDYFFWFWPTTAPDAPKEIIIWLNGGPGCSSMDGFLKENGAIIWPSGSPYPLENPWSYHHISNVVYVDQPVGAGFSTGNVTANNEVDVAKQFMGFWKNFMDTFAMQGYKVYVTGESYAGMYCPYIAAQMLEANNTKYFDVQGMMINDPSIGSDLLTDISINYFYQFWENAIPIDEPSATKLAQMADSCNYTSYMDEYLAFPPSGPQPDVDKLPFASDQSCSAQGLLIEAALDVNFGFNLYQVTQLTPIPYDVLGFPYSNEFTYPNETVYFDRADVKTAIHAPTDVEWTICGGPVFVQFDQSEPSANTAVPIVIERTNNVQINHGTLDMVLTANATMLTIQNMTWNGAMGLQNFPEEPLFVPHHKSPSTAAGFLTAAGEGVSGSWVEERGLTVGLVTLTGHMIPQWMPAVSFRQIQVLLGRVANLSSTDPLPQYPKHAQPKASSLGKGTARLM